MTGQTKLHNVCFQMKIKENFGTKEQIGSTSVLNTLDFKTESDLFRGVKVFKAWKYIDEFMPDPLPYT